MEFKHQENYTAKTKVADKNELNRKLIEAIKAEDTKTVKDCIACGANVNSDDNNYNGKTTALMYAVHGSNPKIAKLLIDAGADVNAKSNHNNLTALMYAASNGTIKTVELLITANADILAVSDDGHSALVYARNAENKKAIRFLSNLQKTKEKELVKIVKNRF